MELTLSIQDAVFEKLKKFAAQEDISVEQVCTKLIENNYEDTREKIISDAKESASPVKWARINLKDGQTISGDITEYIEDGDLSKIIVENKFQELKYEIFVKLIGRIDHTKGLDKNEYFIQPKKLEKE
jgi:predicted CopG family antitoxin